MLSESLSPDKLPLETNTQNLLEKSEQ